MFSINHQNNCDGRNLNSNKCIQRARQQPHHSNQPTRHHHCVCLKIISAEMRAKGLVELWYNRPSELRGRVNSQLVGQTRF